jgi:hypothetical protein
VISISPGSGAFSCQLTGGRKSVGNQGVIGPIFLLQRLCEFLLVRRHAKGDTVRGREIYGLRHSKSAAIEEISYRDGDNRPRDAAKASAR